MRNVALLEAHVVSSAWKNKTFLAGISLSLHAGDCLVLLGANGSGKTTLLRALAGIIKISAGEILLTGNRLKNYSRKALARMLAYVPQNAERPAGIDVRTMVLQGRYPWLSPFGFYLKKDMDLCSQALITADLTHLASHKTQTLSGGEWQRALLARTICQSAGSASPVLLLDEITAGLDPARSIQIFSLLEKLRSRAYAIIISVHDCNLAAMFATHILALENGKILFSGKTENVFTRENLSRLYHIDVEIFRHPDLGCPQMLPRFKNFPASGDLRISPPSFLPLRFKPFNP